MKGKSLKKGLLMALMTTMVFASAFTVEAASGGSAGSSGSGSQKKETPQESGGGVVNETSGTSSSTVTVFENVDRVAAGANTTVAGSTVKSTIAGACDVKSLRGAVVTTPLADIKASLNLKNGQAPYVMIFDTDAKKSPLAMNCVNAAISTQGGTFVTAINVNLGAKENGRFVSLANGSAAMMTGLPQNADTSKTYYVVCVQPGGAISILQDMDNNPQTVTFEIKAGLGTYALVAK